MDELGLITNRVNLLEKEVNTIQKQIDRTEGRMADSSDLTRLDAEFRRSMAEMTQTVNSLSKSMYTRTNQLTLDQNSTRFYMKGVAAAMLAMPILMGYFNSSLVKSMQEIIPVIEQRMPAPQGVSSTEETGKKSPLGTANSVTWRGGSNENQTHPGPPYRNFPERLLFIVDTRRPFKLSEESTESVI